jgi:hypothetical protein
VCSRPSVRPKLPTTEDFRLERRQHSAWSGGPPPTLPFTQAHVHAGGGTKEDCSTGVVDASMPLIRGPSRSNLTFRNAGLIEIWIVGLSAWHLKHARDRAKPESFLTGRFARRIFVVMRSRKLGLTGCVDTLPDFGSQASFFGCVGASVSVTPSFAHHSRIAPRRTAPVVRRRSASHRNARDVSFPAVYLSR